MSSTGAEKSQECCASLYGTSHRFRTSVNVQLQEMLVSARRRQLLHGIMCSDSWTPEASFLHRFQIQIHRKCFYNSLHMANRDSDRVKIRSFNFIWYPRCYPNSSPSTDR
ncbi:hypothetical protein MPTK1_3g10150 [Marchantia polymorpha subsp. ruderalis]|uniref:Uncharacterized protein n=1 Tax=Marchantia polymorpha subsp. ruderalis TaxID=1480154 RepID=A0AAF6AZA0_MARPO|nr:hypothetical protein Mp_3g10150 [Marchantia polymorpha subsp. ruderalis]